MAPGPRFAPLWSRVSGPNSLFEGLESLFFVLQLLLHTGQVPLQLIHLNKSKNILKLLGQSANGGCSGSGRSNCPTDDGPKGPTRLLAVAISAFRMSGSYLLDEDDLEFTAGP